jgi:hypothetical protein
LANLPNSLPLASAACALPFAFHCAPMLILFLDVAPRFSQTGT